MIQLPSWRDTALFFVVGLTAIAAFYTQKASNERDDAVNSFTTVSSCNREFLSKTIRALNERTAFTKEQTAANVDLQTAQSKFFGIFLQSPPPDQSAQNIAFREYFQALTHFLTLSHKSQQKVATNPFPTDEELADCLSGKSKDK